MFKSKQHLECLLARLQLVGLLFLISASIFAQHGVAPQWKAEVQVSQSPGIASGVVGRNLVVDSHHRIHLVWTEQNGASFDVFYARSTDGGSTWSTPCDIVQSPLPAYGPNLAIGPDDVLHLTWNDRRNGGNARVYYSRSFNGGDTWEAPRDLSGASTLDTGPAIISVDTRNRVHIAYHIGNPEQQQQTPAQVFYTRSVNGGNTFEPPRRLNTNLTRHAAFPRFNVEGTNGDLIAIAWRDNRRLPDWDVYLAISTDGGQNFVERVGRATPYRDWDPESIVDRHGVIHLSYMTYRPSGITVDYINSLNRGLTWSPEITLSEERSRFPFFVPDHRHGVLWLFWKDERDADPPPTQNFRADVVCKYSTDGGRSWGRMEFATDLGDIEVKFPGITCGRDGHIYLCWSDRRNGDNQEQVYFKSRNLIWDLNRDGCVDDADLLTVLFAYSSDDQDADVNADGIVDDTDLLLVLFNIGIGCQ